MRDYINKKDVSTHIKAGLQLCNGGINKGKYLEQEYRLFCSLAELYLQKRDIKEYPKVVGIYQYLKKLVEKYLKVDKQKLEWLDAQIKGIERKFLESEGVKKIHPNSVSVGNDTKALTALSKMKIDIKDVSLYKAGLIKFRDDIKDKLKAIEDLGIVSDQEELDEKGLAERAKKVEEIYMDIRKFFIGTEDEKQRTGLVNRLINDCIKQLGGLPRVGKNKHEIEYAVFGMGSLALGTMTPWSDLEFGILMEEGLEPQEEERVKEYFRLLTTLLHIKVINFGETILPSMGIVELNNFKLIDGSDSEHNWFYDKIMPRGFSYDGANWHACKTPLGRSAGFKKNKKESEKEGAVEVVDCAPYELLDKIEQFMNFFKNKVWSQENPQLMQGLGHVVLINGSLQLISKYNQELEKHKELIKLLSFNLLKEDAQELNPTKHIIDSEKEGHILKVKKEIYRFPDRMIVAIGDCLGGKGVSSWLLIKALNAFNVKQRQDLELALSIATELRLRTYASNDAQKEDLSALMKYESLKKESENQAVTEKVFYLKDIRTLYRYYYIVTEFSLRIRDTNDSKALEKISEIIIPKEQGTLVKGYIYKRFLKYYDAIREFESLDQKARPLHTLAALYYETSRNEEALTLYMQLKMTATNPVSIAYSLNDIGNIFARLGIYKESLKYHQESLDMMSKIYKGDSSYIAASLNNIGNTLQSLSRYKKSLKYHQESLEMRRRIYKDDHADIAASLNNIGIVFERLDSRHKESLKCHQESLEMRRRIYKGDHADIAASLNNIGNTLQSLSRYEESLKYRHESLKMMRKVYEGDHADIAALLNNIGTILERLGRYKESLKYHQESLEMRSRIHKIDHSDKAASLNNVGAALAGLGRYEESLKCHQESLEMRSRIHTGDHSDIAASLNNTGNILQSLSRYEESLKYHQEGLEMRSRIHTGDHSDIAASLNNIGNTLQSLSRYKESLKYHQESLKMKMRIYEEDHFFIASSLNNIGNSLESLGRYEEALKYRHESLEMKRRIYKGDHSSIASSLNNIGNSLESLGRYEEALSCYIQAVNIFKKFVPPNHPSFQIIQRQYFNCTIVLANQKVLWGDFAKALDYHKSIGINVEFEGLLELIYILANQFWEAKEVPIAISCYEALSEKLAPLDRDIKHNLACAYHIKAIEDKNKNRIKDFQRYINLAKETFKKALNIENDEPIKASLYVEYKMFLLMHHDSRNDGEYSLIVAHLNSTIAVKKDGSELSYGQIEKATVVEPIQELLKIQAKVPIKPYILAYYLLVKIHCMHNNKEQTEKTLKEFKEEVEKLKDLKDKSIAQYLLSWCHKELESLKIQQVLVPHLNNALQARELTIAEKRETTTAALLQSLSSNHLEITWDYYVGREHRILCELRVLFSTILAKSEEALRLTIEQRSDININLIMEYAEEVNLEKAANDNKIKIEVIKESVSTIRR